MHVLGIDVGGTKTTCLLANEDGTVLARARAAGANLQSVGELALEEVLHGVMQAALAGHDIVPAAICLGIAGVDRARDRDVVRRIMDRIGYRATVLIVNDALIALQAGIGDAPGIVIVSGTGSIAYGRSARGEAARAGGWGHVLGDEGSGYWIGRSALRAVVRHADGRGRDTSLSPRLLEHLGLTRVEELTRRVYQEELAPSDIAALARHVQHAHDDGDTVAASILDQAVEELMAAAAAVMNRLGMERETFSFLLAGGMFRAVPWLSDQLTLRLPTLAAGSRTLCLEEDPAIGAVQLALAAARGHARVPPYQPSLI